MYHRALLSRLAPLTDCMPITQFVLFRRAGGRSTDCPALAHLFCYVLKTGVHVHLPLVLEGGQHSSVGWKHDRIVLRNAVANSLSVCAKRLAASAFSKDTVALAGASRVCVWLSRRGIDNTNWRRVIQPALFTLNGGRSTPPTTMLVIRVGVW